MEFRTQIDSYGRIVLPAAFRKKFQIESGEKFVIRIEDGCILLIPSNLVIIQAQEIIKQYVSSEVSQVDELIRDRRRDAKNE